MNKITELFDEPKKEEAAKYLIEQINNYMQENQRLISENAKLNTLNAEYQAQINSFTNINMNKLINNNNSVENYEENDEEEIEELKNKVDELEGIIGKLNMVNNRKNSQENILNNNNENINVREAFMNALSEIKEKDKMINDLQNKLKENINNLDNNNFNFTNSKINLK